MSAGLSLTLSYFHNPIRTPITDDWLYLPVGTHQVSIFRLDSFELINGHQQVLVKVIVWILGFFPGLYFSYIWLVNASMAFLGFYLLIISQVNHLGEKLSVFRAVVLVAVLFNFKPLYLYMSFTGTGLCLTVLLYGIYYYAGSKSPSNRYQRTRDICAFLAPFATGFGISLAIAHLFQSLYQAKKGFLLKFSYSALIRILMILLSVTLAYLLPLIYKLSNPRSPGDGASRVDNVINLFFEPLKTIRFVCGLLGSALVPSSRYEPLLPVTMGAIVLVLSILTFQHYFTIRTFLRIILLNRTPFTGAFSFVLMLLVFRGLGTEGSVDESLAPRFVMGTSLLLFSILCLFFQMIDTRRTLYLPTSIFICVMFFSLSGLKTGLEWLSIRSQQTLSLYSCLEGGTYLIHDCIDFALPIQEGESSKEDTLQDLRKLTKYLRQNV